MGTDRDPVPTCKECCCGVLAFVSCGLSVRNRCILIALRKLTLSDGSLRPQRFLCPPLPGLEPETSRTANIYMCVNNFKEVKGSPFINILHLCNRQTNGAPRVWSF